MTSPRTVLFDELPPHRAAAMLLAESPSTEDARQAVLWVMNQAGITTDWWLAVYLEVEAQGTLRDAFRRAREDPPC